MSSMDFVLQGEEWVAVTEQMLEHDIALQRVIASPLADMAEQPYDSEEELQKRIENHPNLLAGEQINEVSPRCWLLVKSEMGVPDTHYSSGKYSLDDLFLDQDGRPTLVEVKRITDTRIRRELIGQMLDYAANGVVYWPDAMLRNSLRETWQNRADQKLADLLGINTNFDNPDEAEVETISVVEAFWQNVSTNLKACNLRLLFVADKFPPETLRVIEFLNKSMPEIEALAIEIKQFVSQRGVEPQIKRLVSNVIRHIETTASPKIAGSTGGKWNEASFFENMEAFQSIGVVKVARTLYEWTGTHNLDIRGWGTGPHYGSYTPVFKFRKEEYPLFRVYGNGVFETCFPYLKEKPPFNLLNKRLELLQKLNAITGINLPNDAVDKSNKLKMRLFESAASTDALLKAMDWVIKELQRANA